MKQTHEILRELRENQNYCQRFIANYLGTTQQTYSNYENGRREIPIAVVIKLAKYYQVSTDYLLNSDTSYIGNVDMKALYIDNFTMHDIMYDIQSLDQAGRKDLVKFIRFLHQDAK